MDLRLESDLYNESDFEDEGEQDHAASDEDLAKIDETIQNVSKNMRKGDWTYLCRHPEVRAIIRVIVTEAIKNHPSNIYAFAADLFHCSNHRTICKKINKQMKWINSQTKSGTWSPADGALNFPQSSSSSLNSMSKKKCEEEPFKKDDSDCDEINMKLYSSPDNFRPSC